MPISFYRLSYRRFGVSTLAHFPIFMVATVVTSLKEYVTEDQMAEAGRGDYNRVRINMYLYVCR